MKKYLFILIIIAFFVPFFASASTIGFDGPLVPCGRSGQPACTLCDIFVLLQNIIKFITTAIFIFAPIFIAIGAVVILTSADTPDKVSHGKAMIKNAIIGLIIALLAWVAINTLLNALVGESEGFPWPWNEIKCEGGGVAETESKICTCGNFEAVTNQTYSSAAECSSNCSGWCQTQGSLGLPGCCDSRVRTEGCAGTLEKKYCTCGDTSTVGDKIYNSASECTSQCSDYCKTTYSNAPGCCDGYIKANGCNGDSDAGAWCCCNKKDGTYDCKFDAPYGSNSECNTRCPNWCKGDLGDELKESCCVNVVGKCSEEAPKYNWCQRTAPSGSDKWKIGGPMSKSQYGDASSGIVSLINCIYGKLSSNPPIITAISSSGLCSNPDCDTTGDSCGHAANSCHFGGTSCRGTSYAVDFDLDPISFSTINTAARQCNSGVWTKDETNHIHISIPGCGCQ